MNHISEEDLIKSIEQLISFLPTLHIGTINLEFLLEEYKKQKQKIKELQAWANMTWKEKAKFEIDMILFDEFNDTFCTINEHLGEIYSRDDLENTKDAEKERKKQLYKQFASELLEEEE